MSQIIGKFIKDKTVPLTKISNGSAALGDVAFFNGTDWVAGSPSLRIQTVTATGTINNTEQDLVVVNSSTAIVLTLGFLAVNRKRPLTFKNVGTGSFTVVANTTDLIDGITSTGGKRKDSFTLVPDGGNWWITN